MPGLTLWRRDNGEIRSANASLRAIGCGRGPNNRHFAQQYISPAGEARRYSCASEHGQRASPRASRRPGAAGLSEDLPVGGILADLMAGRQHICKRVLTATALFA